MSKSKNCYLCQNDVIWIDYTDPEFLSYYLTEFSQIKPREKTGICRLHSDKVKKAIKKARQIGVVK